MRKTSQHGFTLLEVMIGIVLLMGMLTVVVRLSVSSRRTEQLAMRHAAVVEANRDFLNSIRVSMDQAVFLPQENALGRGYFDLLDFGSLMTPISAKLPTVDEGGYFEREAASGVKTGNALVYARQERLDQYRCTSGRLYRVPVYRFHCYVLTRAPGGALTMAIWVSEPLADAVAVDKITDTSDHTEYLLHLLKGTGDIDDESHAPIEVVWSLAGDLADPVTLRRITIGGGLDPNPPAVRNTWKILCDARKSRPDLFHYRHMAVAGNDAPKTLGVGKFGVEDTTGDGFPHGFEIQVVGSLAARQILVRLIIVDTALNQPGVFSGFQVIAFTPSGQTS